MSLASCKTVYYVSRVGEIMASNQIQPASQQLRSIDQEEESQRRHLRWCFFFALVILTLAAIVAVVVVFCLTKNALSFSLFTPFVPFWYRFTKYLFPMDERAYELEKLRLQTKQQHTKKLLHDQGCCKVGNKKNPS